MSVVFLTSYIQSKMCRRCIWWYSRRGIKMCYIVYVCIHIIALNGQSKENCGDEEQEAQLRAPVATLSFNFSFAWRSHDLFLLFACILIIHLMYIIYFLLLELCECVCGPTFSALATKASFLLLLFSPLSDFLFLLFQFAFETWKRNESSLSVFIMLFCSSEWTEVSEDAVKNDRIL